MPREKRARGTFRPDRDAYKLQPIVALVSMPQRPDWLTAEGEEVWLDDIGRISWASETDSTLFANYCNLQGAVISSWRAGNAPPISALTEIRRIADLLGLAGERSRLNGRATNGKNPFSRNGKRGDRHD